MKPIHIHENLYLDMDEYQYILMKKINTSNGGDRFKNIKYIRSVNLLIKTCVIECLVMLEPDELTLLPMKKRLDKIITARFDTLGLEDM
jgi:hypothetical protein